MQDDLLTLAEDTIGQIVNHYSRDETIYHRHGVVATTNNISTLQERLLEGRVELYSNFNNLSS